MENYTLSSFNTQSKDGTKLQGHYILPTCKPVAVIYFIHGLGGHSGRFIHPASLFAKHKIASIGIDLRGNGLSDGKRGHAESLNKYMEDIDACITYAKKVFSDNIPKLMMGNSMGGVITLHYGITHKLMFSGIILTAPWLRLTHPISKLKLATMKFLNKVAPTTTFSSKVKAAKVANNNNKPTQQQTDELIHKKVSARLVLIIHQLGYQLLNKSDCYLPTLVLHSSNDPVTDYYASRELCDKHSLSCKLVTFDLDTHEVPFEEDNIIFKTTLKHINKILVAHEQLQN